MQSLAMVQMVDSMEKLQLNHRHSRIQCIDSSMDNLSHKSDQHSYSYCKDRRLLMMNLNSLKQHEKTLETKIKNTKMIHRSK